VLTRAAAAADWMVLRRTARRLPSSVASGVNAVGRAASFGRLWVAAGALLSVTGRTGRRAAVEGLAAYGTAVALSNGPVKWATRRSRPSGIRTWDLAISGRRPRTSSFPSTHTAGAVAFAVAAGARLPGAAPLLAATAGAVGLSRVQRARHFPTDVVGGAVLGGAVGASVAGLSRRWESQPTPAGQ